MNPTSVRRLRAEVAVAWRYLRSVRDDALIHQLSRITVGGLALGVAALILALSVLTGFQEHLLGDVLERSPELQIELPMGDPSEALIARIAAVPGVAGVQPLRQGQGWLRVRGDVRAIEVVSYRDSIPTWLLPDSPLEPAQTLLEPTALGGVHIPLGLAQSLGLGIGDVVELVTPKPSMTPLGAKKPSIRRLPIAGFLSGSRVQEVIRDRVAIPLTAGLALVGAGGAVLDLTLASGTPERAVGAAVEIAIRDFLATAEPGMGQGEATPRQVTWRDRHAALLFVLKLEKAAVFLSVTLIVLVASFALVSSLALILSAKRQELGVLSAVGMSRRRIRRLFLLLGAMFAASGALVGGVVGTVIAWALDRFELIPLPGDVFVVDHVPFALRAPELSAVLLATMIVTLVAAAFGARGATSWTPVEALRR